MKSLVLIAMSAVLAVPAFANHWNFECGQNYKVRINNKKAKLVAPHGNVVFTYNQKGVRKVYKAADESQGMLLAPNVNFTLSQIPMGQKGQFTWEVPGPNEAMVLSCETRPTFTRDPDLN